MPLQRPEPVLAPGSAASLARLRPRAAESVLVTVLLSVHNGGAYLRRAVESIMSQDHSNLELLVIDDGSTDACMATLDGISDPRLIRLQQAHAGKAVALNRALKLMRGEYYAIQDADDISDPSRLRIQLQFLLDNPDVAVVMCGHRLLLGSRACAPRMRYRGREWCWREVRAMRMPALDPTAMYRKSAVQGLEYDPELLTAQGYDYLLRIVEKAPAVVLGDCLYSYRCHSSSTTRNDVERRTRFVEMVRQRAAARRNVQLTFAHGLHSEAPLKSNTARENNLPAHFLESVLDLRRMGHRFEALRTGLICAALHPFDPSYFKALLYALLPMSLVDCIRRDIEPSESTLPIMTELAGLPPPLMAQLGSYDSWHRTDIIELVPAGVRRVLSCGCGSGLTEETLVRRGIEVFGIEQDATSAEAARLRGVHVLNQDVEDTEALTPSGGFDCLIYGDVLEHLRDPGAVLRSHVRSLVPGGTVVISVPNYRNWRVIWQLVVRGHVQHADSGILDKSHMKLTTRRMAEQWLSDVGLSVTRRRYNMSRRRARLLSMFTLGLADEWIAAQVLVVGKLLPEADSSRRGDPQAGRPSGR